MSSCRIGCPSPGIRAARLVQAVCWCVLLLAVFVMGLGLAGAGSVVVVPVEPVHLGELGLIRVTR